MSIVLSIFSGDGMAHVATQGAPPHAAVLAIGNFDGVHRGHAALLAEAGRLAATLGAPVGAVTFEPHPRSFFRPDQPVFRLTDAATRRRMLGEAGAAFVCELGFDAALAACGAEAFVDDILIGRLGAAGVAVGSDFSFGKGRGGDVALLRRRLGRPVSAIEPVRDDAGDVISSSRIRAALEAGDVATAAHLLGRPWSVTGEVIHGDKRGRELGYPTANMRLPGDCRLRHGVYAVAIAIDGVWRQGAASFGRRPTFDNGAPRLETFVLDFSGDLYGRRLEVRFLGFIRGEERFIDLDALKDRMSQDCALARQFKPEWP